MSPDRPTARLSDSHTEMTELLMPDDTNELGRALGGVVLHWMDICGAIAAMRFTASQCVTASIDHVDFHAPIAIGEVATVRAYVFDTGRTSVEVKVDVTAENPRTGETRDATDSFLTYVAVDDDGRPTEVPGLDCPTDAEHQHREAAIEERQDRLDALLARLEE
jgi:acyl-CoA hydrolase